MADGKVKKYFKNLRKMKEEGVNVPKPKKKAVDGKTNYGINWNKKTKVTTPPTGTGQTTKQKTRPADETRTKPFIQGGIGVTKQGKKPKKKDYLTGIKQPPLEAKHAGKVNLDNVKKVEHPFLRLTAKETSDESFETEGDTTKHPMLPGAKKTEYVLQKNGKNKTKTPAPVSVYNNKQRGNIAKAVYGHYDDVSKLKEMTDKDIDHLVKKYQVNLKTEKKTEKKSKKNKKLTEVVNVLSGNQVSQGVIGGTGESIGTKYSNRLFGGKTEKKSKKNNKKRGR